MAKEEEESQSLTEKGESVANEECYEVPWEFSCVSAANLRRARNAEILLNSAEPCCSSSSALSYPSVIAEMKEKHLEESQPTSKIPPTCGLAARKIFAKNKSANPEFENRRRLIRRSLESPSRKSSDSNPQKVWNYRGPEDDFRSSSEYDIPWDLLRKNCAKLQDGSATSQDLDVHFLAGVGHLRKVSTDESSSPKDRRTKSKSEISTDSSDFLHDFREKVCTSGKISASPATSTSSSAGRTSNHSRNSAELHRSAGLKSSCSSEGSSDNLKLSATLLETAFDSKPDLTATERAAQTKDRLVQRLCNESEKEYRERKERAKKQNEFLNGKSKTKKPVPAPRKRNQSAGKITGDKCFGKSEENGIVATISEHTRTLPTTEDEQYDIPWEFCSKGKLDRLIENNKKLALVDTQEKSTTDSAGLDRKLLSLNFGCAGLNPLAENVDKDLPLKQQPWYHGNISRAESEGRLTRCKEGSYLIRNCESNRNEYALSLKSAKGYMHMKIQLNDSNQWILGYFSQPFPCIPSMIRYYSINKLPIKGAEHMCLLYPVVDTLL